MSKPNFRRMSPDEFKAYRSRNEDEEFDREKEADFRSWCKENDEDPMTEEARDSYNEMKAETGDEFWENLSTEDRAGWEDNMSRD